MSLVGTKIKQSEHIAPNNRPFIFKPVEMGRHVFPVDLQVMEIGRDSPEQQDSMYISHFSNRNFTNNFYTHKSHNPEKHHREIQKNQTSLVSLNSDLVDDFPAKIPTPKLQMKE